MDDPFAHPSLCAAAGVTRLPEPLNWRAVHARLDRELAGRSTDRALCGPVLLTLDLDASGAIRSVAAVDPPPTGDGEPRCVLIEADGRRTPAPPGTPAPPARKALAVAAIQVLRFRPAERDGVPVAFPGYRMTVHVGPGGRAPAA